MEFWDYYRELVAYRNSPTPATKEQLKTKFCQLFGTETGYKQLTQVAGYQVQTYY
ncbi:MAG: hypothetical protein RMX35_20135 [Nostoc sp. DcaGUA01]|nr:hypothetical protein [Nostoc sp. DcaGUA01]